MIKGYSLDYDSYMGMLSFLNGYIKMVEHLLDNAIFAAGETRTAYHDHRGNRSHQP